MVLSTIEIKENKKKSDWKYYQKNRDDILKKQKEYNAKNKTKTKKYYDSWYESNKLERIQKATSWNKEHPINRKKALKKYNLSVKEQKTSEKWRKKNRKKLNDINKKFRDENQEIIKILNLNYRHSPQGKLANKRRKDKRNRQLETIPINNWFEDSHGHHINKVYIIYIPKWLHNSVRHNVFTWKNMEVMNTLAHFFLIMQNIKELNKLFS